MAAHYHIPRKAILTKENLEAFQESKTHADIVEYIKILNESVLGVKLLDNCPVSPVYSYLPCLLSALTSRKCRASQPL